MVKEQDKRNWRGNVENDVKGRKRGKMEKGAGE